MNDLMITVACYEDRRLAEHHAELLRNRGLTCDLKETYITDSLADLVGEETEYMLKVPESEATSAFEWLAALEHTALYEPAGEGDSLLLIGAVLAMVGILTSFGRLDGINEDFLLLPYALALVGGCLFLRGLMVNRMEESHE